MYIDDLLIQKVDLVDYASRYTDLKRVGRDHRGRCPIHGGNGEQSFSINNGKYFHCFACGSAGTIVHFKADLENISYAEAVDRLCDEHNIDINEDEEYAKQRKVIDVLEKTVLQAQKKVDKVMDYLINKRGLTEETVKNFRLGCEDGTLVIPVRDVNGRTIAIAKRHFTPGVKYTNSKNSEIYEKGSMLFNLDHARRLVKNKLLVCEGYIDAMSAEQQGLPACAYAGADITKEQVKLLQHWLLDVMKLSGVTVILCPDGDEEGQKRIPRMREKFLQYASGISVRVMQLPEGVKDFNDALLEGRDIESFPTVHIDKYCLEKVLSECGDMETEYSVAYEFVKSIRDGMIRADISNMLAARWNKPVADIRAWLSVSSKSPDEQLREFVTPEQGFDAYLGAQQQGTLELGFPGIDKALNYVRRTEVVLYGAYPSVGKTYLAIHSALANVQNGRRVLFCSLEMSASSLYERITAMILGVSTEELERMSGAENSTEIMRIKAEIQKVLSDKLYVIDENNLTIDDIQEKVKALNLYLDEPIDMVIIDYLQYLKLPGSGEYKDFAQSTRKLKSVAKDCNVVILALSQLNRQGDVAERPNFKMLRGGGDLESTADICALFWRPAESEKLSLAERDAMKNVIMCALEKVRRGLRGSRDHQIAMEPEKTRFRENVS